MTARTILSAAALALVLPAALLAQPWCPLPPLDDGFELGCCQTPSPNLPNPPQMTLSASYGVYNACTLGYTATAQVILEAPNWFFCDYAAIPIQVWLPNLMPSGTVLLGKYVRTWTEPGSLGLPQQVWRILVNGDFPIFPSTVCQPPACIPPCTGAPYNQRAHFVGHIDYACDPFNPNGFSVALSLSHLPGCLQHAAFSTNSIPALANSPYSYHLVGPAPFTFTPVPAPQGPLLGDSARTSTLFFSPLTYLCHGEAAMQPGGSLTTTTTNCLCTSAGSGWQHQNLTGATCCFGPSAFQSLPIPGTPLAPTGFAAFGIGQWNAAGSFPGTRELVLYVGVVQDNLTCSPVLNPFHVVTGVGTTTPFASQTFPQVPTPGCPAMVSFSRSFIDLQNMLPLSWFPNTFPGIGSLFVSDYVLSLNIF